MISSCSINGSGIMKKIIFKISIFIAIIFVFTGCTKNTENLIATVDGDEITKEQFDADYQVYKYANLKRLGEGALEQIGQDGKTLGEILRNDILEQLIMENLVAKEMQKLNIGITEAEIDDIYAQYEQSMEGKENFEEFLTEINASQDFFRDFLRRQLLKDKYKEIYMEKINISENDQIEFFDAHSDELVEIHVKRIVVSSEEEGIDILNRIKNGEDFSTLAILESKDKISAKKGGDLGYFRRGDFIYYSEFEEVAFSLDVGQVSDLVMTDIGYQIIYLEDKKDKFEQLQEETINMMKESEYLQRMQELRNNTTVMKHTDLSQY